MRTYKLIFIVTLSCAALYAQRPPVQWDHTIGGTGEERLTAVKATPEGGAIIGGWSYSDSSGDKSEDNIGAEDYWITKLRPDGSIEWENTTGGNDTDRLRSLETTSDGGCILAGLFYF